MKFSMTHSAQGDSKANIKEAGLCPNAILILFPQLLKWNRVMVGMKDNSFTLATVCLTVLACVIVALEYCSSPSYIRFGLSQYFLLTSFTVPVVVGLLPRSCFSQLGVKLSKFLGAIGMEGKELGDAETSTVHPRFNGDNSTTTTLTKVFTLMFGNPKVYTFVVCLAMITCVVGSLRPTHHFNSISFNTVLQEKSDELLETLPSNVEGNQQPSLGYTQGRFNDYLSGADHLITGKSVRRESDDIVYSHSNMGQSVNGLKFNTATLMKSRYCPGTYISGTGDPVATTYVKQMSNGALLAYPTVSAETLWWINARKPYANMYISNDAEYGLGFTGFKPGQGNTKVAGQVLFAGAVTFAPRYHKQLYGITG